MFSVQELFMAVVGLGVLAWVYRTPNEPEPLKPGFSSESGIKIKNEVKKGDLCDGRGKLCDETRKKFGRTVKKISIPVKTIGSPIRRKYYEKRRKPKRHTRKKVIL